MHTSSFPTFKEEDAQVHITESESIIMTLSLHGFFIKNMKEKLYNSFIRPILARCLRPTFESQVRSQEIPKRTPYLKCIAFPNILRILKNPFG